MSAVSINATLEHIGQLSTIPPKIISGFELHCRVICGYVVKC